MALNPWLRVFPRELLEDAWVAGWLAGASTARSGSRGVGPDNGFVRGEVALGLNRLAVGRSELPRFVPQGDLPPGRAYESHIHLTGCVPTRDTLHDAYNGLMWLACASIKARLNGLQAQALAREGVGSTRGALRDALTLWDEHGAWWRRPDAVLLQALKERDWHRLFVVERERWLSQEFMIFGHALLEQLHKAPRKGLTAHVLVAGDPLVLGASDWADKPFWPLPVLGIPGWWSGQEAPDFYTDTKVFRPARNLNLLSAP